MTRTHFAAAAKQVRAIEDRQVAATVAKAFADLFQSFNPLFDRERFYTAAGVEL
jgi:hypothetical protein